VSAEYLEAGLLPPAHGTLNTMPELNVNGQIVFATKGLNSFEEYAVTAQAALVLYDHLLTLNNEIRTIWFRPFTGASIVFLLNRYLCLAFIIASGMPVPIDKLDLDFQIVLGSLLSVTLACRRFEIYRWEDL